MKAKKIIFKTLGIALSVIFGLALLCSIAATMIVKTKTEHLISRRADVGFVYLSPLTGALSMQNLRIYESQSDDIFLRADHLYIRLNPYALIGKKVRLRTISLDGMQANISRNADGMNFDDIITQFTADTTATDTESSWIIDISGIELTKATVSYQDLVGHKSWQLKNMSLQIPAIYLGQEEKNAGIRLSLPQHGGELQLTGSFNSKTQQFTAQLESSHINFKQFLPLLQQHLNIKGAEGVLDAQLIAIGSLSNLMETSVRGIVNIDALTVQDHHKHTIAECETLNLKIRNISMKNMLVDIDNLSADSLHLDLRKTKSGNTLSDLFMTTQEETKKEIHKEDIDSENNDETEITYNGETINPKSLHARLSNLQIQHSTIRYLDKTLPSDFKYSLTNLTLQGTNIDTYASTNHIVLSSELPHGGSLMLNWRGGLDLKNSDARIVGMIRNLQLEDLSPWVEQMFGYSIKGGTLSLSSDNSIVDYYLEGTQNINLYRAELGKKKLLSEPTMPNVPLKMALNLLEDVEGNINLIIPVEGDLNEPQFNFSDIIGKAIGQVFLKATAAPFLAMAKARNKTDDLSFISLNIVEPDFQLDQYKKLDLIAEMMQEKKDVNLRLTQTFNMQEAIETQGVFNLKREFYEQQTKQRIGELTIIDISKIQAIKDNYQDFAAFAKEKVGSKGSLTQRAINYYGEEALRNQVLAAAERRNDFVMRYLTEQKKIQKKRLDISLNTEDALLTFKGKPQYIVE